MGRKESNQTNSLGIQIYEGGFDLLIVLDYMLFFPYFLKILHKKWNIFVSEGDSSELPEPSLDRTLGHDYESKLFNAQIVF